MTLQQQLAQLLGVPAPPEPLFGGASQFVIWGNAGSWLVDARTGDVLEFDSYDNEDSDLGEGEIEADPGIRRFDLVDWTAWVTQYRDCLPLWYATDRSVSLDLVDFGYWHLDGTYEPPNQLHREWRVGLRPHPWEDDNEPQDELPF